MSTSTSVLEDLLQVLPQLRPQLYFKPSLTALSHAMEDLVLAGGDRPLVIANFQRERFYRQEAHRYRRIAGHTSQVYVLAAPETDFRSASELYETVAFEPTDTLSQEWHLVVVGGQYASCLVCRERFDPKNFADLAQLPGMDQSRRFEGIWTFDRQVSGLAATLLLNRIEKYRPELREKINQARSLLMAEPGRTQHLNPGPFAERLVTYLQAGQYKLLKAYRSIAIQERKERLVNSITNAIHRSLNLQEIFQVAVQELGQALGVCRCLIYGTQATDLTTAIAHEFLSSDTLPTLTGQTWFLQENPLFQEAVRSKTSVYVEDTQQEPRLQGCVAIATLTQRFAIRSWLMVPIFYKDQLRGMVELHHCGDIPYQWQADAVELVEAVATQVGVALIQAEAYRHLQDLNEQLEALDRTRSNLTAIIGHELRTPLSTIQVCLESLVSEPDMPFEVQQVMLNTALGDADRLRELVRDFLTLSRLESGQVEWNSEALPLQECVDLAVSSVRARYAKTALPEIHSELPDELPLVYADGEWLVEVLNKLLDNACKFTPSQGQVQITAALRGDRTLAVTIADTGRGIEPNCLEAVFDRFYQEEGALRRTAGGTGLGLAICRQIVKNWGGEIWAQSAGKDQGSQFRFTLPLVGAGKPSANPPATRRKSAKSQRR